MLFEHRYAGSSGVRQGDAATAMSFAPDTLREPTYFRGNVIKQVEFREAISALHDVVTSDLRFIPKDRTAYLAVARAAELHRPRAGHARPAADRRRDRSTRQRSSLALERAASTQRRSALLHRAPEVLRLPLPARQGAVVQARSGHHGPPGPGVLRVLLARRVELRPARGVATKCSRSSATARAARRTSTTARSSTASSRRSAATRPRRSTSIRAASTSRRRWRSTYREVKIDLPDSWVRGFLQVSVGGDAAGARRRAAPDGRPQPVLRPAPQQGAVRPALAAVPARRPARRSRSSSSRGAPWSRARARATSTRRHRGGGDPRVGAPPAAHPRAPAAARHAACGVFLLGTGLPTFWVVDLGDLSFTLGLSGWTNNNWSEAGNFDLMAAREDVDDVTQARVFDELGKSWLATPERARAAAPASRRPSSRRRSPAGSRPGARSSTSTAASIASAS